MNCHKTSREILKVTSKDASYGRGGVCRRCVFELELETSLSMDVLPRTRVAAFRHQNFAVFVYGDVGKESPDLPECCTNEAIVFDMSKSEVLSKTMGELFIFV